MKFDLAIIGGGPAGYNAAADASSNGLKTVLFEKAEVGGVCLNEGCIPTKALLHSAHLYSEILDAKSYGVTVNGTITPEYKRIAARKSKIVKKLTAGVAFKLKSAGVETIPAVAKVVGEKDGEILIEADGKSYSASYLLLCSGSETVIPPIPGIDTIDYWTSREALASKELPADITIIGGGVIGMEFADIYSTLGVKVTVVEMMPEILGAMDKETSAMLRQEFVKRGVNIHLNTKVTALSPEGVTIQKPDGSTDLIPASKVLLSVGRRASTKDLGLETLSIEMDRSAVKVNEYMQTSHPRVYAAGDITGFSMLAHTAIREGEVAIGHIVGHKDEKMSYAAIPGVVYTHPEIAGVGATEESLQKEGRYYRVLKLPMAYSGRYVVENEVTAGLCKVLVDENDTILGCHVLGNPASELILIAGIAIENQETVESLKRHVYPHPTVGEILHEVLHV